MKILFVYPRFQRHAQSHPELLDVVPMNEYLGSPSLGIACLAALTPPHIEVELRDDRLEPADRPTDADLVAFSFFTPAATRALELARYFREQGVLTVAGGIFPTAMPDLVAAHFDAVVEGEGEGVWLQLLDDLARGELKPRYRAPAPPLETLPLPAVSLYLEQETDRFQPDDYPVQLSRGCPLQCQACILPASMGAALRPFSVEQVLAQLRELAVHGKRACLTEDTSWLPGRGQRLLASVFDRLVDEGAPGRISYVGISMPMILSAQASLLQSARRAGVTMFYLVGGFDPITTRAFNGKDPRALERAYRAIARCHDAGIEPYTSFLYGLDDDDDGTVDRMLEFCERAKVRKAEFAIFTPYPGTPAWRRLASEGRIVSHDWQRYNDANVVYLPAKLTPDEVTAGYLRLWREFYADKQHFLSAEQGERTIQF